MIIGEMRRYFARDNNVIRVSRSIGNLAYKGIRRLKKEFTNEQQREATVMEIAEELGVTKRRCLLLV